MRLLGFLRLKTNTSDASPIVPLFFFQKKNRLFGGLCRYFRNPQTWSSQKNLTPNPWNFTPKRIWQRSWRPQDLFPPQPQQFAAVLLLCFFSVKAVRRRLNDKLLECCDMQNTWAAFVVAGWIVDTSTTKRSAGSVVWMHAWQAFEESENKQILLHKCNSRAEILHWSMEQMSALFLATRKNKKMDCTTNYTAKLVPLSFESLEPFHLYPLPLPPRITGEILSSWDVWT